MSPPTWTMPHPPDVQPEPPEPPHSDFDGQLLDASSLNTVLDMLAVIDSAEDLALLECLTVAQKRQVWDATPESIKLRLKQIRLAAASPSPETTALETFEPQTKLQETLNPPAHPPQIHLALQQGDRVILLAKPQLTAAEMKIIWEVVKVEADQAHVKAAGVSDRQYPIAWMVRYPN